MGRIICVRIFPKMVNNEAIMKQYVQVYGNLED